MTNEQSQSDISSVPRYHFSESLKQQEVELSTNPLLQRMRETRDALASDPHRPVYHYASPGGRLNDPNGLCCWQGKWHLFYQAIPPDENQTYWGHVVSPDLIHWRDLPYGIYPGPEKSVFSGSTLVEEDRVIAMYQGTTSGNFVAISDDPLLLNWTKVGGKPVLPFPEPDGSPFEPDGSRKPFRVADPCIWKNGSTYYSLSRQGYWERELEGLFKSDDLQHWEYVHPFVENDVFTLLGDDGACPYFWPIGDRHILLFFSHMSGGQYLLGDYDTDRDKFVATSHGKFNFGAATPSGVHAPSATPDGNGGVITIFNMNAGKPTEGWDQIMTLPRRLTLTGNDQLGIEPVAEAVALRGDHQSINRTELPANQEVVLEGIQGTALELSVRIDPKDASVVEVNVLRSPGKEEFTKIAFFRNRGFRRLKKRSWNLAPPRTRNSLITLDTTYSSSLPDVISRAPETAPVRLAEDETLTLNIFVDRSVVEVFVNGNQCVAARVYPGREDSLGVSVRSQGQGATLISVDAWQMQSI